MSNMWVKIGIFWGTDKFMAGIIVCFFFPFGFLPGILHAGAVAEIGRKRLNLNLNNTYLSYALVK
ncbi:hypothetical protein [Odoribacter splanchnicus]|uniref:hypothetical protein n=2 Tax=Odoribacter splanchnicus TaxID=28118 RepID=UPI00111F975F|nr:hypothetical protein [Odoribacter splanchnicus]